MAQITCKELISIFEKIGGKLVCTYDTKTCTLLPNNVTAKITSDNRVDIDMLLSSFAHSGQYDNYVTIIPETEKSKKNIFMVDTIHNYQEKNSGGFIIEFAKDKEGFYLQTK